MLSMVSIGQNLDFVIVLINTNLYAMTHKQARIKKGFARQQCEAFTEEFDMSIQSGVQSVTISDGIATVEIELVGRRFLNKTTKESGTWCNVRACLMNQFKK